jgi:decaprenylphospho-beta-D-erythro-pentofuranosid-2-ulose 2-reductase
MADILIIGAGSDIAKPLAREYAAAGNSLYLAGRNADRIESLANDLRIRHGIEVLVQELDVLATESHEVSFDTLPTLPAGIIAVAGYLGEQNKAEHDFGETRKIIDTNFTGIVSLLNIGANRLQAAGHGFIIGISSVAGDRGRKSNYIYGSSKAALTTYLSGLRNRLCDSNVHVMTVKPGFVETRMTAGMKLPRALTAQPEEVARDIFRAQQKRRSVIYTRGIWRLIMLVILHIPESIFKKTSI